MFLYIIKLQIYVIDVQILKVWKYYAMICQVSVFDSVVQGGDSVWEGLRVYNGKIFKLEEHLDRWCHKTKKLNSLYVMLSHYSNNALTDYLIA